MRASISHRPRWMVLYVAATLNRTVRTLLYGTLLSEMSTTQHGTGTLPPPLPLSPSPPLLSMSLILRYGVYTVPYTGYRTVSHQR